MPSRTSYLERLHNRGTLETVKGLLLAKTRLNGGLGLTVSLHPKIDVQAAMSDGLFV